MADAALLKHLRRKDESNSMYGAMSRKRGEEYSSAEIEASLTQEESPDLVIQAKSGSTLTPKSGNALAYGIRILGGFGTTTNQDAKSKRILNGLAVIRVRS